MSPPLTLWHRARLATLADGDWSLIDDGALLTQGAHITWIGRARELPRGLAIEREYDLGGALVTPGLVDCHTHLVYAGCRATEAALRLSGASYEQIARAGGGIRSTVAATRAASEETLLQLAVQRARTLRSQGVTTLEIKSGYGLDLPTEARCLRVARRVQATLGMSVRTTYLGAHAVPPEFEGRREDYIEAVCEWLPILHAQGLVDAVDAFCEHVAFTPAQIGRVFATARRLGLPVKLHAEQLSHQGGAALAASFSALSCDHLEYLDPAGIEAMRTAATVAVLLPGAYYLLRETRRPPVAALREAGVPIAVATDHNPGTSPTLSLPLMAHMACVLFGLTPLEAVLGITRHAARALGLHDRGCLAVGQRADLAVWALDHPNELCYWFGHLQPERVVIAGEVVA